MPNLNDQSGFGIMEVLLILVVVGVLGATGWYTWNSKNKTDRILAQAAANSQTVAQTGGIQYAVNVPAAFKKQLQADYAKFKESCAILRTTSTDFKVVKNVNDLFIEVDETCGSQNSSAIYSLQNNTWASVALSTGEFACTDVDQNKISKQLAPTCYVSNLDGSQTIRANTYP